MRIKLKAIPKDRSLRRKKGFFSKLWDQNTVKKVDFESRVPLLVLKGAF